MARRWRVLSLRALEALMSIVEWPVQRCQRLFGLQGVAWLFLLPSLSLFLVFSVLPAILNVAYSVTGSAEVMLSDRTNVGLENFAELAQCDSYANPNSCYDDLFWRAAWNTAIFVTLQVGLIAGLSLVTAITLNGKLLGRSFFRSVFFFPVLLSPVVVAMIWKWILQRNGLLDAWIEAYGLESVQWLLDSDWAFFWSLFVSVWAHMGFYTLILLAGLQAIPQDIYDAARMDRASPIRIFRRITIPLLMPTLLVVLLLSLIKGVQTFDEVYALTGGGPGSATTFMVQYIYETGFAGSPQRLGLAAAASMMMAVVLVLLIGLQVRLGARKNA